MDFLSLFLRSTRYFLRGKRPCHYPSMFLGSNFSEQHYSIAPKCCSSQGKINILVIIIPDLIKRGLIYITAISFWSSSHKTHACLNIFKYIKNKMINCYPVGLYNYSRLTFLHSSPARRHTHLQAPTVINNKE